MDERSLLIQLCRCHPKGKESRSIADLASQVRWDTVLDLGTRHDLLPLLHSSLQSLRLLSGSVPGEVTSKLERRRYAWVAGYSLFENELGRIRSAAEAKGAPFMVLKGPVLGALVYEDVSLRSFTDIDLVIRPEHRRRVREILTGLGYQFMRRKDQEEDYYLREVRGPGGQINRLWVDVHHRMDINMRLRGRRYDLGEIWRNSVAWMSEYCRRPGWEDFLCHLATHASLDFYPRFILVCDIDRLVRRCKDLDWDRLLRKAREYRCRIDVWLALWLASSLLDTPVPAQMVNTLGRGDPRRAVIEHALGGERIFSERAGSLGRIPLRLATTDRLFELPGILLRYARLFAEHLCVSGS